MDIYSLKWIFGVKKKLKRAAKEEIGSGSESGVEHEAGVGDTIVGTLNFTDRLQSQETE